MAEIQSEVTVNYFTDINALRQSEHTITCMTITSSGRAIISELIGEELRFPNVEKLCFKGCYLKDSVTRFLTGLPKLKVLEFDRVTVQSPKCIEQCFPTLERLMVFNNLLLENGCIFTVENVKRAVQLNPQLKGIGFRCDAFHLIFDRRTTPAVLEMLRFIKEKLHHLQYLGIHFSVDYYNDLKEPFVFKSVTKAELHVEAYNFKWGPTNVNFPIEFVQLRELQIFSYDMFTDDCVDFAVKHKSLEKLLFHFYWLNESDDKENVQVYEISYEEDEDNKKTNGHQAAAEHDGDDGDDEEEDEEKEDSDEYCEDDDESLQYDCYLNPFIALTKSLPNLKDLSIGPLTKFTGEDIVKILSPAKALERLHVKLRYPLRRRSDARYAGVKRIEQQLCFVKDSAALEGDWSCQVKYKFKQDSESEFRIADLIFQRNCQ